MDDSKGNYILNSDDQGKVHEQAEDNTCVASKCMSGR